jgi:flagellar biosynthesis protein FlhF
MVPPAPTAVPPLPTAAVPVSLPVSVPVSVPVSTPVPAPVAPPAVAVQAVPAPAAAPAPAPIAVAAVPTYPAAPAMVPPVPGPAADARVMAELQSLRSVLSDRINHLEARIAPIAAAAPRASVAASVPAAAASAPSSVKRQALTRLIMSGFSPELARRLSEAVPRDLDPKAIDSWLQSAVGRQIACPEESENPLFAPGAVALVGPTGVGKTTTIAKLAARFVVRHGAAALGLVTLDSYRIGAHEQLRSYGRILGVPVQSAHDAASLRELLAAMHGKHQVLIDTCGMSQRDQRLGEMLAMLDEVRYADRKIRRVLLVNAASHAETIDEVARAWRVEATHGAVLTKIDEAARIGGALDAMMRFRLPLLGLTNGQRVPEDWHPGNPLLLAHIALKPFGAAFCLDGDEVEALSGTGVLLA